MRWGARSYGWRLALRAGGGVLGEIKDPAEALLASTVLSRLYRFADVLRDHARRNRMTPDHALGRRGEDLAQRFLQGAGMIIVDRNYRMASGAGEVDLVAWDANRLVFVEVKCRMTDEYGAPDRAIGEGKRASLLRAAREYSRRAEVAWD